MPKKSGKITHNYPQSIQYPPQMSIYFMKKLYYLHCICRDWINEYFNAEGL